LHLICHGFVKANLFLCVGTVIHSSYGSQEHRACAGPSFRHPFLLMALVVSSLSLRGLFFITCYASKHLLVTSVLNTYTSTFFGLLLQTGLVLSVAYSWRLVISVLVSPHRPSITRRRQASLVTLPIGFLTLPSICAGPALSHSLVLEFRVLSLTDALVPVLTLLLGFLTGTSARAELKPGALSPFSCLRKLSYATLCCVEIGGPIAATEQGPLSPLFYKGLLKAGMVSRSPGILSFPSFFIAGIIIAALLVL